MNNWRHSTWGEEIALEYGKALREYGEVGAYRVFGTNGAVGWTDRPLAPGPGVILGRKGAYRGVHYSSDPFFVIDTAYYVVPKGDADMRWLYYAIIHHKLGQIDDGSPIPSTTRAAVYPRELDVPPVQVQRAIAGVLGSLDDKIEQNRWTNRALERLSRAIFRAWFVDFEPVKAKAAGATSFPSMPQDVFESLPTRFVGAELGEIPESWRISKIEDIAHINGWTLGRRDVLDVIDYIEISEVMRGEVHVVSRYARGEEPSRARRRLKHGDTVLSTVRPDRGAYFLALNPADSLIASTGFAVLTPKDGNWAFLHAATTSLEFGQELGRLADGGAYPAVRPEVVGSRSVVLPDNPEVIAAFEKVVQPLLVKIDANMRESRKLAEVRDYLLPKLMSGQVRVRSDGGEEEEA